MVNVTNRSIYDSSYIEALFASIDVGLIATDSRGDITFVNDAALDMFGYTRKDILNERFINTIVPAHEDGMPISIMDRPIAKAFMVGHSVTERTLYKRADGSLLPTLVTVSPIKVQGRPTGAVAAFRDITQEIETDRMKSDFISLASHQLRTPLSSINLYAHLLHDNRAGDLSIKQKLFIDTILSSAQRMNELINTLLNITRIESGNISMNIHKVQVDSILREVLEDVKPTALEKGLTLRHNIESHLAPISTDDVLVREVCNNLLTNAIKYTPGGGKISVTVKSTKYNIVMSVSDTGYGIPKAAQERIFTKFFRASNILSQDPNGTGIGLYLTKMIAENLGGDIWFESAENKGSTFFFSLPKAQTDSPKTDIA